MVRKSKKPVGWRRLVELALAEDVGSGDRTTVALGLARRKGRGRWHERDVTPEDADPAKRAAEREVEELLEEDRERQEFANVVGWQPLVLNAEQRCADCGRDLRRGDRAFLGPR